MKLRTSFFDKTVFRKDITRFAPLWAIYFIGGLLVMLNVVDSGSYNGYFSASSVGETIAYFAIINLIYAAMAAQLLFGDLYNTRLCNALHAMPMRRENWFLTHLVSGLLFSLVPNGIGIFIVMPQMGDFWFVAFIWLLGMTLEYLFFFGLAVFSIFCTGNRFAMAAVYGILNGASMIALWFVQTVYEPQLYGVTVVTEPFQLLCPIVQIMSNEEMILWSWESVLHTAYDEVRIYKYMGFGEGWGYLAIVAAIGVALLALSLVMYRRRKLESAGDFIAVSPLAPVFGVVYTLCVGAVFAMFGEAVGSSYVPYLLVGLPVGWFTGRMLLQRTVKVFSGKNFLRCGIVMAAVLISIFVTMLDPLGITRWTPEADQVASVTVSDSRYAYRNEGVLTVQEQENIQSVIDIQKYIIQYGETGEYGSDKTVNLYFTYKLKDGRTVKRGYFAWVNDEVHTQLRWLFSDPKVYIPYDDWRTNPKRVSDIYVDGQPIDQQYYESLLSAVEADSKAGSLAYDYQYHDDKDEIKLWISITYRDDAGDDDMREVRVYGDSENLIAWLKENQSVWFTEKMYGNTDISDILG